jgi:hypothetical protein
VCPGAALARLEALSVLDALAERVAAFSPVGGFTPVPNPVFWALGQRTLPVVVTVARAPAAAPGARQ